MSWLSSGFGALAVLVPVAAVVVGGFFFTVDRSEAKSVEAARAEVAPLRTLVEFMLVEQRESRIEVRGVAARQTSFVPAPLQLRPLAPLPVTSDGGP